MIRLNLSTLTLEFFLYLTDHILAHGIKVVFSCIEITQDSK